MSEFDDPNGHADRNDRDRQTSQTRRAAWRALWNSIRPADHHTGLQPAKTLALKSLTQDRNRSRETMTAQNTCSRGGNLTGVLVRRDFSVFASTAATSAPFLLPVHNIVRAKDLIPSTRHGPELLIGGDKHLIAHGHDRDTREPIRPQLAGLA